MALQAVVMEPGPGWDNKESDFNDETDLRGRMDAWNRHGVEERKVPRSCGSLTLST